MKKSAWDSTSLPGWPQLAGSGTTHMLSTSQLWPIEWMNSTPRFSGALVSFPSTCHPLVTTATTARVVARLLTERNHADGPAGKRFRYNEYLYVRGPGGSLLRSDPIPTYSPPHHSSSRPSTWGDHPRIPAFG